MRAHPFHAYSIEAASYTLGEGPPEPASGRTLGPEELGRHVKRTIKALNRGGWSGCLLFGLGEGRFAQELACKTPSNLPFTACTLSPDTLLRLKESGMLDWWFPEGSAQILADESNWAHVCLLAQAGLAGPEAFHLVNPELPSGKHSLYQALSRTIRKARPLQALPSPYGQASSKLTLAAILRQDEPRLETFFSKIPDLVDEIVLIWDGEAPPPGMVPGRLVGKTVQKARPLADDFSSQRNLMLGTCSSEWILYLDADETLAPATWESIPSMLNENIASGYWFPRLTFHPDESRARIGFGLWPDLQLRLFLNQPGIRFQRPVHERLVGLEGASAILPKDAIHHYSHVYKKTDELENRLRKFDMAGEGAVRHRLNRNYPNVPLEVIDGTAFPHGPKALMVPGNPG